MTGFTKLKGSLTYSEHECEESVMVEDIEELVNNIIERLNNHSHYNSETMSNNCVNCQSKN